MKQSNLFDTFSREAAIRDLDRLKQEIEEKQKQIGKIRRQIEDFDYKRLFEQVANQPIDWTKLFFSAKDGPHPDPRYRIERKEICIVCRQPIKFEEYFSGRLRGRGLGDLKRRLFPPFVYLHDRCAPRSVRDSW